VDPQSRSAEFSAARGPGLPLFGILKEPTAVPSRAPPRALSADREPQPVRLGGHKPGGLSVGALVSLPAFHGKPLADRGTSARFEATLHSG
jgi:hypothetical protein